MAKLVLVFLFISSTAYADFLGFGSSDGANNRISPMVEKLKGVDISNEAAFEEAFNQTVKQIEIAVDEEKLFCSGEGIDGKGQTLPQSKKQLCFRELKTHYVNAVSVIFDMKKKYLGLIHKRQVGKLSEIQARMKADIEKSF